MGRSYRAFTRGAATPSITPSESFFDTDLVKKLFFLVKRTFCRILGAVTPSETPSGDLRFWNTRGGVTPSVLPPLTCEVPENDHSVILGVGVRTLESGLSAHEVLQ